MWLGPKLPKWLPKLYGTSLLSIMGCPKRSWWIKVKILRVSWWLTSASWWRCGRYRPVHIIHKPMANVRGSTPLWSTCLGCYPRRRSQSGRTTLECWFMPTIAPEIQLQGSVPTTSCLGDNLSFQLMWHLVWHHVPSRNQTLQNLFQKIRECAKLAQTKAEAFQSKEAQWHKRNYDKRGKAVALEVRDMVLVHVTTLKGHHKIQDRWENREYVVEKWPYPNVPIYVECPRNGEGHIWTLHRKYLLPINPNIEQDKKDKPVARVGNTTSLTPVPPVDSVPADAGLSGTVTPSTAGSTSQGSLTWPAPLRCGTRTTQNQLPWRYWNFSSQADTSSCGI